MKVAVVKYNAGNIYSVIHALQRMGVDPVLTDDASELRQADRVLFPGQGEASTAMRYLRERGLDEVIRRLTQPVLGICIGQQLLCRHSEEGDVDCLGIFDAEVKRFCPERHEDKVPHMGWNDLKVHIPQSSPDELFQGFHNGEFVYFEASTPAILPRIVTNIARLSFVSGSNRPPPTPLRSLTASCRWPLLS